MSETAANNEMWACQHCADTYASMPSQDTCFECGEVLIACIPAVDLEALKAENERLRTALLKIAAWGTAWPETNAKEYSAMAVMTAREAVPENAALSTGEKENEG